MNKPNINKRSRKIVEQGKRKEEDEFSEGGPFSDEYEEFFYREKQNSQHLVPEELYSASLKKFSFF